MNIQLAMLPTLFILKTFSYYFSKLHDWARNFNLRTRKLLTRPSLYCLHFHIIFQCYMTGPELLTYGHENYLLCPPCSAYLLYGLSACPTKYETLLRTLQYGKLQTATLPHLPCTAQFAMHCPVCPALSVYPSLPSLPNKKKTLCRPLSSLPFHTCNVQ